ncbi:MAG: spondin domain-containing protein [Actinomycetota bacterium]
MRFPPDKTRLPALALALALVAAACGGGASSVDAASDGAETAAPAQSDDGETGDDESMEDEAMEDEAMEDEAMEDGATVTVLIENIADFPVGDSGVFDSPDGADAPGPALPGSSYSFTVTAAPGQRLSFATMLVQSNDWFLAPMPEGIALYDDAGAPISGDITDQIHVFDAGTEIDQPFGEGADQAPRQSGPDTGVDDPDATVRLLADRDARDYVGVVVESQGDGVFEVRVTNDSQMAVVPSPLAPGVYAAHTDAVALFELGQADPGYGLEALAEDGDASALGAFLDGITGTATPLAPGAYAAHGDAVSLYELGGVDPGLGLEALAEDGDPSVLAASLAGLDEVSHHGAFDTPVGGDEPGPLLPGGSYRFEVPVVEGERLSFATMFVQSNDWIIATPAEGLDLAAVDGDISDQLLVVDVGTEVDQTPGVGADQAPRQAGPDTGADDPDTTVRLVEGRSAERYVRVTVER